MGDSRMTFKVGEKVNLEQFECVITSTFEYDGKKYVTVKPIEFDAFEREVEISKIRKN